MQDQTTKQLKRQLGVIEAVLRLPVENRLYPRAFSYIGLVLCLSLAFWVEPKVWLTGLILIFAGFVWRLIMNKIFAAALLLLVLSIPSVFAEPEELKPVARIAFKPINECSGIVKSRQFENTYWTHNDSGDKARIFAIKADGSVIKPHWWKAKDGEYQGIKIHGAYNIDWEDIGTDDKGNLLIAACGNNYNSRSDLAIYILREPMPTECNSTILLKRIPFHFPDQIKLAAKPINFDCEAVFSTNGKIYLISKHRSDMNAKLYRLDSTKGDESNELTLISEYKNIARGGVTGADISADGKRLAVLTYRSIYLFEKPENSDNFFAGKVYKKEIAAKQCEAVCFDGEALIITNEQRDIFRVAIDQLKPVE